MPYRKFFVCSLMVTVLAVRNPIHAQAPANVCSAKRPTPPPAIDGKYRPAQCDIHIADCSEKTTVREIWHGYRPGYGSTQGEMTCRVRAQLDQETATKLAGALQTTRALNGPVLRSQPYCKEYPTICKELPSLEKSKLCKKIAVKGPKTQPVKFDCLFEFPLKLDDIRPDNIGGSFFVLFNSGFDVEVKVATATNETLTCYTQCNLSPARIPACFGNNPMPVCHASLVK